MPGPAIDPAVTLPPASVSDWPLGNVSALVTVSDFEMPSDTPVPKVAFASERPLAPVTVRSRGPINIRRHY